MDPVTLIALMELFGEYITLGTTLGNLIKRAKAGETVTDDELKAARQEMKDAVAGWDAVAAGGQSPVSEVPKPVDPVVDTPSVGEGARW